MIGTTRRVNPLTNIIEFTRFPSNKMAPPKDSEGDNSSSNPDAGSSHPGDTGLESIIYSIDPVRETEAKKLIFQLGTANPDLAVEAATIVASDVAGIDVNAGCPKSFSTDGGMGAALLKTPDLLCSILRALVEKVGQPFGIGISVKIRILATEEKTVELVEKLCRTGITGLTVHCRMTHMRPRERALREQVHAIVKTCRDAGVACLINGDVKDRADGLALMEQFGVDGAMIATAAEKNPSVFRPDGAVPWRDVVGEYVETAIRVANRWGNTKFLLAQVIPGKALQASLPPGAPVNSLAGAKTYSQLVTLLDLATATTTTTTTTEREDGADNGEDGRDYLTEGMPAPFSPDHVPSLLSRARALDSYLGLGGQVSRAEKKAQRREQQAQLQEEAKARREAKRAAWEDRKRQRGEGTATMTPGTAAAATAATVVAAAVAAVAVTAIAPERGQGADEETKEGQGQGQGTTKIDGSEPGTVPPPVSANTTGKGGNDGVAVVVVVDKVNPNGKRSSDNEEESGDESKRIKTDPTVDGDVVVVDNAVPGPASGP